MTLPGGAATDLRAALLEAGNSHGEVSEGLGIDEMLRRYAGEFGCWQLKHFVLTSLAWALEAFHTMVMIFSDEEPGWRCVGLTCSQDAMDICIADRSLWEWIGGQGRSTVSEWGLVCGEKYKVGLAQSGFFAGALIGAGIFGHLSDSFLGRKGSLTVVCALNGIFGLVTAASPAYWIYLLMRILTGISSGGVGLSASVLATEPVGPTKRGMAGMSSFYFFSGGIAVLAGIAYVFPSWRMLYIVTSIPSLIYFLAVLPFISESPRWYLVRGHISNAMKIMHGIATANGNNIPPGITLTLDDQKTNLKSTEAENDVAASGSLIDVLKSPVMRIRLLLMVVINFACSIVYYGISLNVVNLHMNIYLNVFLNAISEMPAFLITAILLEKWGRKVMTMSTMCISGVFCLAGFIVMNNGNLYSIIRMLCGVIGIFGMAGTYNLLYIYTAELFPTVVRNAALGCTTQAGQVGAILSPLVVLLGSHMAFAVFAVCAIGGGLLAFYLPETLNQPLYDTMAGIEEGAKLSEDLAADTCK